MSKIVCDVCGSSYSETESQCPICGTAKPEEAKPVVETPAQETTPKAGKFSQNNNRKPASRASSHDRAGGTKPEAPSNTAMIAIVAVLLLAIVAVCVIIVVRMVDKPEPGPSSTPVATTTVAPPVNVDCTGIELVGNDSRSLTFTELNETAMLTVKALPENTTETVTYTFASSDPAVVLVDSTGKVTPVAAGTATITVSYRNFKIEVAVSCNIPEPVETLLLTKEEITLSPINGTSCDLYTLVRNSQKFDKEKFVITSDNAAYVRVEGTKVIAVDNRAEGVTVTVKYGEQSATIKVRVQNISNSGYQLTTKWTTAPSIQIHLYMGEAGKDSCELKLIDKDGKTVTEGVQWTVSNDFPKCCDKAVDACVVTITTKLHSVDNSDISGGYVWIRATYEGETYTCRIYVHAAATQE